MKISFLLLLVVIVFFDSTFVIQPSNSTISISNGNQKFDSTRDAKKDIRDAVNLAQKVHKRILLDVGGDWCIWCHRLDSLFLQNKSLAEYLNRHYVVVKVNVSKENKNQELLSTYPKVAGYPHLFVLDEHGTLLQSQDTGELEYPKTYPIKGHDREKVSAFLKKWAQ